jgi:glycerol-3-phosphate dehydrogenase (NAD(P)+)
LPGICFFAPRVVKSRFSKITVLGSGSWATALVKIISEHPGTEVMWWMRSPESRDYIQEYKHNPRYLSSVEIRTDKVFPTNALQEALAWAEVIVIAIPSAFMAETLEQHGLPKDRIYVSAVKGIDPRSKMVIARYLESKFDIPSDNIGLITGPCHAEEVALEKLSYLTISALNTELAEGIQEIIACRFINTTVNNDLYGAEYAAVLKNIYAIGAGIAHGLGYGDNFQAVYVGAALREMEVFLDALHETHRDVKNAAYLGDLLVTCYSQFSRNRTFGNMLGKGYSVASAQLEMNMVAEGYYATDTVFAMCKEMNLNPDIINAVHAVVYGNKPAKPEFARLAAVLT